jgi:hypothetical protein
MKTSLSFSVGFSTKDKNSTANANKFAAKTELNRKIQIEWRFQKMVCIWYWFLTSVEFVMLRSRLKFTKKNDNNDNAKNPKHNYYTR